MAGTPADKDQLNHPTESEHPTHGQQYLRSGRSQLSRQDSTDYSTRPRQSSDLTGFAQFTRSDKGDLRDERDF